MWRMRAFYLARSQDGRNVQKSDQDLDPNILPQLVAELKQEKLPQAVAEIPWGHNVWLLEKLTNPLIRLWYARKTVEHGWSRAVLTHHIETGKTTRH
jgi:predicted nuclease of restriction endonuclease-like (RecB) superfamily